MNIEITKDESKPTIQLSDSDMQDVARLSDLGFGQPELPDNAHSVLTRYRNRNRKSKAERFAEYYNALKYICSSTDPKHKCMVKSAIADMYQTQSDVARRKVLATTDVHVNQVLSNFSVQYANEAFIGEELMPVVLASNQSGTYFTYTQRNQFSAPDDEIGSNGQANEISKTRSTSTYTCRSRALKDHIGADVIANQDAPLNEMLDLIMDVNEAMAFKREQRIATVLTTNTNYGTNTAAVPAADRWNTAGGGNPISDMQTGLAALWRGKGQTMLKLFSSIDVFHVLSRHPDILGLFQYNGSSPGLATPDMIAKFLTADTYLIGAARQDTANEAATAVYTRIWGDSLGMVRVATNPTIRSAHFGSTFRWNLPGSVQGVATQQWFDPVKGIIGSFFGQVGVSETHDIVAASTGYLITTPIN
jgi:hypothetical protein